MKHFMNLNPEPFELICSGKKTIELRLFDEKRRAVHILDTIVFTNTEQSNRQIVATVINLYNFSSFSELYNQLPLLKCGYTEQDINTANPDDMNIYYSKELQKKYGVVGIEIAVDYVLDECNGNGS